MVFLVFLWLLFGIAGAVIMSNKGRSGCGGFALGALLGPIGLIIALVLKSDHRALEIEALRSGEMRKCPDCAELVKIEARKCRFCGAALNPII
jgi:hypothetical protein